MAELQPYIREPGTLGRSFEFKEWSPAIRARVSSKLMRIQKRSVLSTSTLRPILATLRGFTLQIGDLDHVLYIIAGFVAEESVKRRGYDQGSYSLDFLVTEGSAFLGVDARLFQPGRPGSTMYGMWICRVGENAFVVSNTLGPAA